MAKTVNQASREVSSAEKAAYHQITGAGRAHVKRPFFDVNPADVDLVVDRLEQYLIKKVQADR